MKRLRVRITLCFVAFAAGSVVHAAACGSQAGISKEQRQTHRLHWDTRSEIQSAGFDIFRSEKADGGFVKVNAAQIPAANNSLRKRSYEYVDDSIDPCKTYYYYVEAVSTTGYREKVSDVLVAKPKSDSASPIPSKAAEPKK